jgi:heme O synthase-like polyprenyltransferase
MSNQGLVLSLVAGGALLALWLDFRLAARMPRTPRRVVLHAAAALVATTLIPFPMVALATQHSPGRALVALFAFVLPVFVYSFLTWIWLVKLIQRLMSGRAH